MRLATEPTSPAERAFFRSMPLESRILWCPLRDYQIDAVVCSRMQQDNRRACRRASGGHCCRYLDASWAEELQQARR